MVVREKLLMQKIKKREKMKKELSAKTKAQIPPKAAVGKFALLRLCSECVVFRLIFTD